MTTRVKPPTIDRQALRERIKLEMQKVDAEWDRLLSIGGDIMVRKCGVCDGKRQAYQEVLKMLERLP